MSRPSPEQFGTVIEELANALQGAVGLAALLRRDAQTMTDDTVALERAVARAASALRRLQPSGPGEDAQ